MQCGRLHNVVMALRNVDSALPEGHKLPSKYMALYTQDATVDVCTVQHVCLYDTVMAPQHLKCAARTACTALDCVRE